jgi:amidase
MTSLPVITVPCGKTPAGLPIGIQLIGRPHGELQLFSMARWFEQVFAMNHAPIDPVWGGSAPTS